MNKKTNSDVSSQEIKSVCGIIMPISGIDDCPMEHWTQVKTIIYQSIAKASFTPKMVNESEDVAIIHRNIVSNIYENPIIVCDVSHRNPNVMLELGMRLAFGKHVVIVKDDKTTMPFDAGVIEFISYPRDLRYPDIEKFIETLANKIIKTFESAQKGDKSTFLEYFGQVKPTSFESTEISSVEYFDREFSTLHTMINLLTQKYDRITQKYDRNFQPRARMPGVFSTEKETIENYEFFCREQQLDPRQDESCTLFMRKYGLNNNVRQILADKFDICPF